MYDPLYKACSFAITGSEDLGPVLRALCYLELHCSPDYYASHANLTSLSLNNVWTCIYNVL